MRTQSQESKLGRVAVAGHVGPVPPKPEEFKFVKFGIEESVARLTLNRPEHNMLNERMLAELVVGIDSLDGRPDIKLIVLDSATSSFCGGIELGEYTPRRAFQVLDALQRTFTVMLDTAKPLLVVVNGPAFGGGAELAALGDLVIATSKAKFAQPEIKLGVYPPLGAAILPYIVGPKRALELVLTGEVISAERALALGLVNRVVAEDKLEAAVKEMIAQVTAHSGPVLTMAKKAILGSMGLSLREGVRQSMEIFLNELSSLEDASEGLRAIAEKRSPQWKNR